MAVTLLNPGGCEDDCYECGECPVRWFQDDCRLFWYVPSPPVGGWTVTITHPDTSQDVYTNVQSAMIETPATGTYSALLTIDGTDYGPCEIEFAGGCSPVKPCCFRTAGIYTRVTPEYSGLVKGSATRPGNLYDYAELDTSLLTYESLRVGSMSSGTKTDSNCYDVWGVFEEIFLGTGYLTRYLGHPHGGSPPSCVAPGSNYYYQRIYYDFYVRFSGSSWRLYGEVTGEDYSVNGSPGGSAPAAPSGEVFFAEQSFGACAADVIIQPSDVLSKGADFSVGDCGGTSSNFIFEYWPDVIPL